MRQNFGIFVKNRIEAVRRQTGADLDIIAPIPYFPRLAWPKRWAIYSQISGEETLDGFKVYHPRYLVIPRIGMWSHGWTMYRSSLKLAERLHHTKRYHLIDAHWIYPDGWAAVHIGKKLRVPVVLSARGNDINEYIEFPTVRPLIKWSLEQCDHIISVCQALKDLMTELGVPESKITVLGNGVDTERFFPIQKTEARRILSLPTDRPILLSVGILEPRKGHHILIQALSLLRNSNRKGCPHLYIVGDGFYGANLRGLIKKWGLTEYVRMVGEVPHQMLRYWYSAADLLCLASDREGWPNVLLEAMACGTPVAASNVFGVPEIVTSADVGVVVAPRTAEAFSTAIEQALKGGWDSTRLVAFAERHSWEKVGRVVDQVFRDVLTHRTQ